MPYQNTVTGKKLDLKAGFMLEHRPQIGWNGAAVSVKYFNFQLHLHIQSGIPSSLPASSQSLDQSLKLKWQKCSTLARARTRNLLIGERTLFLTANCAYLYESLDFNIFIDQRVKYDFLCKQDFLLLNQYFFILLP